MEDEPNYDDDFSETYSDEELIEDDDDVLINENFDSSAKEKKNEEEINEEEEEKEEEEEEIEIKRTYKVYPYISIFERTKLICDLSELIANSKLIIPKEYEIKYLVKTGNSKIIAEQWVNNYRVHHLPLKIIRYFRNTKQIILPQNLIFLEDENIFSDYSVDNIFFNNNFH